MNRNELVLEFYLLHSFLDLCLFGSWFMKDVNEAVLGRKLGWQTFLRSKKTWLPDKKPGCQSKILTSKTVF